MSEQSTDRGSLPIAMLITTVAMSLSAMLVPMVVNQVKVTRASASATQALDASQTGVDVAVAQLRAASDADGSGILENLPPCRLTGSVDADSVVDYDVSIEYFDADDELMSCPPLSVPARASVVAAGTGAVSSTTVRTRTITATYTFRTSNANVDGGAIRIDSPTVNPLCMDSGSTLSPLPNTKLTMRLCVPNSSRQRFAYTKSLNLRLVGSETKTYQLGMCLNAATQTDGVNILFQPCKDPVAWTQQWSLNDSSSFRGTTNGINDNGRCMNLKNPGSNGSEVILGGCGGNSSTQVFRAEAGVGAGMAGESTGQLVNYKQFSRCLDVTNHSPTFSYMIVWFCKQAPDGNVSWNQKWTFPKADDPATTAKETVSDPGQIRTTYTGSGAPYCLRSPGGTASNQYVTMETCTAANAATKPQKWTVFGNTDEYERAFQIQDDYGYCLTPTALDATPLDVHTDGTAKVKVAKCDGSELQKWNAPANLGRPTPLTNVTEK